MIQLFNVSQNVADTRADLDNAIATVINHGKFILGPEVEDLEARLANYVGVEHCVAVGSGTDALVISLMSIGISPGDEVITTPFTFVATVEAVIRVGATPVFVDVDSTTGNLDLSLIIPKITAKTKAIISVSLYGQPQNIAEILEITRSHSHISVIEDASQSFGSSSGGVKSCGMGNIGCTSFFPTKPLGCMGDGGALFTNDFCVATHARKIRQHGQSAKYQYDFIGLNSRLDTIQAAILIERLKHLDNEIDRKNQVRDRYIRRLPKLASTTSKWVEPLQVKPGVISACALFTIKCSDRDGLKEFLKNKDIESGVYYPTLVTNHAPYKFNGWKESTPIAAQVATQVLSLPMHSALGPAEIDKICEAVEEWIES